MKKIPVIFDTDPGIDDAIALALALKLEELDIKLVTTVAGNVGIDKTTKNALDLLHFFKRDDIVVAKGATEPLIIEHEDAAEYHGVTGLGTMSLEASPNKAYDNAVYKMYEVIMNSNEKITIIAIGPLTNVALLIKAFPEVKDKIEQIVMMGGATHRGNKEVMAEYNIAVDPHSAKIVFNSGIKMALLTLEIGNSAKISESEMKTVDSAEGQFCYKLLVDYKGAKVNTYAAIYDATAVAYLVKPEMFETKKLFADVEINGYYTNGTTVIDMDNIMKKEANIYVPLKINNEMFKSWILNTLK